MAGDLATAGVLMSRRTLLAGVAGLTAASGFAATPGQAAPDSSAVSIPGNGVYPPGFLWGAATAGHQVEGNNVNSDLWLLENVKSTIFVERSGDAVDHYHRYAQDIALLAALGFNSYRFSIEWSRIEPEPGLFSLAELDHYRRVLACCHEHGIAPVVTFIHVAAPRWFAAAGGWQNSSAPALFARYCERATKHLGDLIAVGCTINEPNIGKLLAQMPGVLDASKIKNMLADAAAACGSGSFVNYIFGDQDRISAGLLRAHAAAAAAIKSAGFDFPVGVTLAMSDDQAVGTDSMRDRWRETLYGDWLRAASHDDFVGVQVYTRSRIGREGPLPNEKGVPVTQVGLEFWPEALGETIRYAYAQTSKPIYVTENGVATEDDSARIQYIDRALAGLERCLKSGIPVKSYIHWSFIDNFEWMLGYRPRLGLVAVDRATQLRTPKPSAHHLGRIAMSSGSRRT